MSNDNSGLHAWSRAKLYLLFILKSKNGDFYVKSKILYQFFILQRKILSL